MTALPARLTDLLDAVNVCLSAIGETPVADIDNSSAPDVSTALNIINEHDKAVQSKGWAFNRDEAMTIQPDANGEIVLPAQTLVVDNAYLGSTGSPAKITQRGNRLYNRDNHSFSFGGESVQVDIVTRLPFEDLPEVARRYITIMAADQFQGRVQSSLTVARILDRDITLAMAALEAHEDEAEARSGVHGNRAVSSALHGNRGMRRNRRG